MSILNSRTSGLHRVKLSSSFAPNILAVQQRANLSGVSEQPLKIARRSAAEIFWADVKESLTRCAQEDLENSVINERLLVYDNSLNHKMTKN